MNNFDKWLQTINEELASPVVAEPTATGTSDRAAMIADIDNIMTSLETLAGEIKESLNEQDTVEEATEYLSDTTAVAGMAAAATAAAGVGVYKGAQALADWSIKAPKARKAQAAVNQMKITIISLQSAFRQSAKDSKKRQIIKERIEKARESAEELQNQVDTRYENASNIVKKAIANEKLKGQMEVAKLEMGDSTPERQEELKVQLKKYNDQYQSNTNALKELEPSKEDIKAGEDRKKKAKANSKEKDKQSKPEENSADAVAKKAAEQKEAEVEKSIQSYDKNIEAEMDRVSKLNKDLSTSETEKEASTNPDEVEKSINIIKSDISKAKQDINQMKTAKEKLVKSISPKESLVNRAEASNLNELAAEISEKAEWQLDGTVLYNKYDKIIRTIEATNYLNETLTFSIKDKFSKLL